MKYPRFKEMLIPYLTEDGTAIRVGGHQMNIARDIEVDDIDEYFKFIKTLNGKNSIEDIALLSNLTYDQTICILSDLKEIGLIYENNAKPFQFNEHEKQLYSRNLNFFSWVDTKGLYYNYWELQYLLKKSNVLLLGAGGTGSHCAKNLARMGFGNITIVDCDNVELSNLNRQEFRFTDTNRQKVEVLKEILNQVNPFINITAHTKKIQNEQDIISLGMNYDVVICCIDKPKEIHKIMEEYTKETSIPWILGGYASTIMNHALFTTESTSFSEMFQEDIEDNYDTRMIAANEYWKWDNAIISPIASISGSISSLYCFYYYLAP